VAVNPSTGQLKASTVNASTVNATTKIITPEVYNTSLSIHADVASGQLTLSGHHIFLSASAGGMEINGGGASNGIRISNKSGPISLSTSSSNISITSSKGSVDI
jgi:PBP1b-binding outer membrane lipoprotein LpoB